MKTEGVRRATASIVALLLSTSAPLAHAQAPSAPPADLRQQGEQQERRQQEQENAQRGLRQTPPDVLGPAADDAPRPWPAAESPCQPVQEVVLSGEQSESFQWTLSALTTGADRAIGRCLGVQGLNIAAERAQRALLAGGYVTSRVLLQPQDLSSGSLNLTLIPGRIRAIRFAQPASPRANAWNVVPARPGDILNLRDIEQALENFKRVPTAEADIRIEPADAPGESDLVIAWQQAFPFRFNASFDDSGTKATGQYQGSATLSYDHWWTLNDLFYVTLNHDLGGGGKGARGTQGHTVHYSAPWDHWLLGFTETASRYHQDVAGLSQDYVYSGSSETTELKLSRLIHRDASRKSTASLKAWLRRGNNFIDDTEVQPQRRATGGWEMSLAHKEFIGSATLDAALSHKRGTAAFRAIAAPEDVYGEGTSRMRITTADVSLNAPFKLAGQKLRYAANWRAQWNGTPLTPQDRFAIGGRYTVRGFDGESSLLADRGWFVRNDIGWGLGDSGQEAYLGLDYGQVRGPSSDLLVGRHLAGVVLGLRGGARALSYDFFIGKPVSRPAYFRTAARTAGFSLNASF